MSLGFDLNDLFEMSKVEENDQPIFISKTGEFNFMLNKVPNLPSGAPGGSLAGSCCPV